MIALSTRKVTGAAVPHPLRLWPLPILLCSLIAAQISGLDLGSANITMLAALAIILVGLPHGTLDIEIAAVRFGLANRTAKIGILIGYLAGAAFMAAAWLFVPSLALTLFLVISIVHFSRDWRGAAEPFLATMVGWALIALPALSHRDDVAAIFTLLTASSSGATISAVLACTSVPAAIGSLIYAIWAWQHDEQQSAVEVTSCIIAALFLPPLVAFAIFFCLLHSPRHMAESWRNSGAITAPRKRLVITAVMLLALGLGVAIFAAQPAELLADSVIRSAFILLSVLTVPHFALELAMARKTAASHS